LANTPNLTHILRQIGYRMQGDEDVLFLFMTSHGSEDGQFAIELGELGLNNLRPLELRQLLDESSIKWRVIVVSACYSGQFIESLASPTTLVITAAAKDKTSFGCAHENHWTYFGEAYFKDALTKTHSFVAAFEQAKLAIAAREQREGKDASEPQISLGSEIAPILVRFAAQFDVNAK
jgi:Peptidase C13 family